YACPGDGGTFNNHPSAGGLARPKILGARNGGPGSSGNPGLLVGVLGPRSSQLFPTAAIDKLGNIVVAWYDNRRGLTNADGHFLLDVFARYSTDGGGSRAPPLPGNDPNNPLHPAPGGPLRPTPT